MFLDPYKDALDQRYPTMELALRLFAGRGGKTIVETGSVRMAEDWGAGMSTVIFGEFVSKHGGHLWTVDNDSSHLATCRQLTAEYAAHITYCESDSVEFLAQWARRGSRPIDLLYLDSWDYPYGELLNLYGGYVDIHQAIRTLQELGDEKIVELYGNLVLPCQEHCRNELLAAWPTLHEQSIVLIDDNGLPGGGKPRLAHQVLKERGWQCLLAGRQTLWGSEP